MTRIGRMNTDFVLWIFSVSLIFMNNDGNN